MRFHFFEAGPRKDVRDTFVVNEFVRKVHGFFSIAVEEDARKIPFDHDRRDSAEIEFGRCHKHHHLIDDNPCSG